MNILVLNGSPLKNGITNKICEGVFKDLDVNVKTYYAYHTNIRACIACNYCFKHENECVIKDELQELIIDIDKADIIVLASPIHFSSFSGELLAMVSRFQYLFALQYHHKKPLPFKEKKGITIITGGNNYPTMFDAIKSVDSLIFSHINVKNFDRLLIKESDKYSVDELLDIHKDKINEIRQKITAG